MLLFSLFIVFWAFSGLLSLVLFGLLDKHTNDDNAEHEELLVAIGLGGPLSIIVGLYAVLATVLFDSGKWDIKNSSLLKLFICYYRMGNRKESK